MKYEAVFGDQGLFDGCYDETASIVIATSNGLKFVDGEFTEYGIVEGDVKSDGLRIAMRRIIRTPTWTVADQKAGKLPEVGMIGALKNGREIEYLGKSVGGTLHHVRFVDDGECIRISLFDFFPIESPEEKAARLRKEWCKEASGVCSLGMTTLTRIYDAMLSGELSTPSKDGE